MPPMMEIITAEQLMEYLGECLKLFNRNSLLPHFCLRREKCDIYSMKPCYLSETGLPLLKAQLVLYNSFIKENKIRIHCSSSQYVWLLVYELEFYHESTLGFLVACKSTDVKFLTSR